MTKRKREGGCALVKRIRLEQQSNKRKFEGSFEPKKRFFSNKDHYIKQLETCVLEMDKKIKQLEYLLQMERYNSHILNIHM